MKESLPEIQNHNNSALANQTQIEQFKSLYYLFKAKRDTDIKLFSDNKHFRKRDVIELNDLIYQKLRTLNLLTDTNCVTVGLSNKEIRSFGNWNEFIQHNWNISPTTNYIAIEWDFNILFPGQDVPQTHTMRVRMGNGLRPNEMLQVIFQGGEETDLEEAQAQVVCKIDFVNAQICSELKMIVSNWYDALPNNSADHKLILFLVKNKLYFKKLFSLLLLTSILIILNHFVDFYLSTRNINLNNVLNKYYFISTLSILFVYITITYGKIFSDKIIEKSISKFSRNPIFQFTKGDENKYNETKSKNDKLIINFFIGLLFTIGTNIIAYIIGTLIPSIAEIIK